MHIVTASARCKHCSIDTSLHALSRCSRTHLNYHIRVNDVTSVLSCAMLVMRGAGHVQGVHQMFEGCADRMWKEGEDRQNKLVFIGKELDEQLLKEGFEDCLHVKPVEAEVAA